jgi:hypothetical protein
MNAALGLRFALGLVAFFAGAGLAAFLGAAFLGAAFLAAFFTTFLGAFLAAAFFAFLGAFLATAFFFLAMFSQG